MKFYSIKSSETNEDHFSVNKKLYFDENKQFNNTFTRAGVLHLLIYLKSVEIL